MTPCQILIIDDDPDDVEILSESLKRSGVDRIHNVNSPIEAFSYLHSLNEKEDLPNLIITDHYLPRITGTEFMQDLKGMELYKNIPVIVVANVESKEEMEKYRQLGAIDQLKKPSSYEEYVQVAKKIVEQIPELHKDKR
jgi:CheY-like chemotaxis protein